MEHEVVIVGGGIAGLATAVALKRVGIKSMVLERSHELRATGAGIGLFPNAWRALEVLGVAGKLAPLYPPTLKGLVSNLDTGVKQPVSFSGTGSRDNSRQGVRPVHRKALLEALANELEPGTIRFSSKLSSIKTETLDDSTTVVVLRMEDGDIIKAKVLIGCDGVHSVVAQWLGLSAPIDSGRSAIRGMAVFPEGHGNAKEVLQFIKSGKRAGVIPLNDKEFYWFMSHASIYSDNEVMRKPELIQKELLENLAKDFPEEYKQVVMHADLSTLTWAPLMFRAPWNVLMGPTHKACVAVAGDAFHPMTPDLAQGGGSALEDAVVLGRHLSRAKINGVLVEPEKAIDAYVKERRWRVAGLIVGAYFSGWVQQGSSGWTGWAVKRFRDLFFYAIIFPWLVNAVKYDCGELPSSSA